MFLMNLQPRDLLGKDRSDAADIEVGQWFHISWGWNDLASGVGTMNSWRNIMENTIGRQGATTEERVASFVQANAVMSAAMEAIDDTEAYPDADAMEAGLLNCTVTDRTNEEVSKCMARTNLKLSGG